MVHHVSINFPSCFHHVAINGDWSSSLTVWEQLNLEGYAQLWKSKFGTNPHEDGRAVVATSQSFQKRPTMAHADGSFPTLLASGTPRLWSFSRRRWMTAREQASIQGLPVRRDVAAALKVPELDILGMDKPHKLVGNGMHLPNVGMFQCAVMACVDLHGNLEAAPKAMLSLTPEQLQRIQDQRAKACARRNQNKQLDYSAANTAPKRMCNEHRIVEVPADGSCLFACIYVARLPQTERIQWAAVERHTNGVAKDHKNNTNNEGNKNNTKKREQQEQQ